MSLGDRIKHVAGRGRSGDARVAELEDRIVEFEARLAQQELLQYRLAELLDFVSEALVPMAKGEPEETREILQRYLDDLGS